MTNEFIIIPSPTKKGLQAAESLSKALNSAVMSNALSNCDSLGHSFHLRAVN